MRKYSILIIMICLRLSSSQMWAQLGPDTKSPVSPEAAAVKQYSSFPMNYSSGMPNITIPLYEIKSGDITIPISISYTSNGLKPNEPVGCVGTGWVLNVEPSVSCSARGLPDNTNESSESFGGYFYSSLDGDWTSKDYMKEIIKKGDTEADRFSYQLADQSGSFYVSAHNSKGMSSPLNMITTSTSNERIQIYAEKTMNEITIYDAKGLKYEFGGNKSGYGLKREYIGGSHYPRLVCSDVTSSRTGAKVSFIHHDIHRTYDFGGKNSLDDYVILEDNFYHSNELPILTKKINGITKSYRVSYNSNTKATKYEPMAQVHYEHMRSPMSSNYIRSPYLKEIKFDGGTVEFSYVKDNSKPLSKDTLFKSLDTIRVRNMQGEIVRQIILNVIPYKSTEVNPHPRLGFRTKLESVEIKGPGIDKPMVYRFKYQDEMYVPPFNVRGIDHWGYYHYRFYRFSIDTVSIVPKATISCIPGDISSIPYPIQIGNEVGRGAADEWYPGIGMLQSITSPEGTETSFQYESNRAYAHTIIDDNNYYDRDVMYVGGLRVKSIRERDLISGNSVYRTFTYDTYDPKTNTIGNKRAGIKPYPDFTIYDYTTAHDKVNYADVESRVRMWSASSVYPMSFNNGNTVLYNYVEELTTNDLDSNKNKTVYYFTSIDNYVSPNNQRTESNMYFPTNLGTIWGQFENEEYANGYPLRTEYYEIPATANGTPKLVSKKEYQYSSKADADEGSLREGKVYNATVYYPRYSDNESNPYRSKEVYRSIKRDTVLSYNRLKRETEILYISKEDSIENVKAYTYPDESGLGTYPLHRNPSRIVQHLENGQTTANSFLYAGDNSSVVNEHDTGNNTLKSNRNYTALIEQKTTKGNAETVSRLLYENSRVKKVLSRTDQMTQFDTKAEYTYDDYGNVRQVYENGTNTIYIWSYNNQYMFAKVENVPNIDSFYFYREMNNGIVYSWAEIMMTKNKPADTDFKTTKELQRMFPESKVYTYEYKPLVGVVRMIDPNGIEAHFEYDGLGRLTKVSHSEPESRGKVTISEYKYNQTFKAR